MKKLLFLALGVVCLLASCQSDKKGSAGVAFISPEAGNSVRSGTELLIDLDFGDEKIDSIVYLIDSMIVGRKPDTSSLKASTTGLPMGNHVLTAKIYSVGSSHEITSNIIILAATAPQQYSFTVVKTYPHDTTSYVEGLEYHDGLLYESDGNTEDDGHGGSSLRVFRPETGKILKKVDIGNPVFAEGITIIDNKLIQLTWKNHVGYVYDKTSLEKLSEFPYPAHEGWGLAFDGRHILNTADGSNLIYFLNKDTYQQEATLEVYDNNGPVDNLNELEFINGKIYANVYTKPVILIINPLTGAVEGKADLSQLLPKGDDSNYVLNGIAWDEKGKRLFVTGKWWDKLYEIKLSPLSAALATAH